MADHSPIEWTDATWNPVTGCAVVSPGCTNCYAMKLAGTRLRNHPSRADLTRDTKAGPVWTGEVRFNRQWLDQPIEWRRPRRIFVCAHGDLFAEGVPDAWIDEVFAVMAEAPLHTFQVLTKRAARMRAYLAAGDVTDRIGAIQRRLYGDGCAYTNVGLDAPWPLPNLWLGVSAEDQARADERVPELLATPAAIRFLSAEPLLGPIDLTAISLRVADASGNIVNIANPLDAFRGMTWTQLTYGEHAGKKFYSGINSGRGKLDWVIAGGESGPGARPMHPGWARSLRDQCADAGIAFFFKQWGEHLPVGQVLPGCGKVHGATAVRPGRMKLHCGGTPRQAPEHAFAGRGVAFSSTDDGRLTFRIGKKAAGRLLDGVEHSAFPRQPSPGKG